ncbi:MAG TPA: EAL domain-containing protein [Pyrinomonadaceae bacterium]|nr:EAL domain-containing protein [Pyrinomonadaceae bacterium]
MNKDILKVLLIEDDEDDYILTTGLLNEVAETEYAVTWISKYADGLAAILADDHDVCLIDYRLGEGTGTELLTAAVAKGCRLPMILLTGQDGKEIDIEAARAGAADYLVKGSIESSTLERAIRYAVAHGQTLETLRESESRFRSVVESANDAIFLMNDRGVILSWNRSAETIFGYCENEILGRSVSELFPASYSEHLSLSDDRDPLISSGILRPGAVSTELNGIRFDGREFPLEITLSSWDSTEGAFYSGIVRDVTERKSLENQLIHQALHDPLTKLANRVLFRDRVSHALDKLHRSRASVGVLFLDLDNFKNINDTLGHDAGDQLLNSVADRLRASLRSSDTAARLGGDEFAVLVEDSADTNGALLVAERIMDVLREPFLLNGKKIFVGTSIGIATAAGANEGPEELLRNADVAMYNAKSEGKDRYAIFESTMHDDLIRRVQLEADMRTALDQNQFEVYYQPIVNLDSESVVGLEALVRWNHPHHGLILPLDFIPVAEETGLIIQLGRWVLEEACAKTREWQTRYGYGEGLSVSVNIGSRQFQDESLVEVVETALEKSGLPPQSLILEITESTMLTNTDAVINKLSELRRMNIRFAIDDFGTGYSSLSYLQRFPVDILKIDKSFIDKIAPGNEGAAVAKAIITMSDTLRLKTIAEGIENSGQKGQLLGLGCELGQGFHFAEPLRAVELTEFLSASNFGANSTYCETPTLSFRDANQGEPDLIRT